MALKGILFVRNSYFLGKNVWKTPNIHYIYSRGLRILTSRAHEKTAENGCHRRAIHTDEFENNPDSGYWSKSNKNWRSSLLSAAVALIIGSGTGYVVYKGSKQDKKSASLYDLWRDVFSSLSPEGSRSLVTCTAATDDLLSKAGQWRPDLPDYTYDQVADHVSPETRIWVTFRGGVYDITEFAGRHPGGSDKILMAVGGSLEPFWEMYGVHKTEHVLEILEGLRIGNVDPEDLKRSQESAVKSQDKADDFYRAEPKRHPALKIDVAKPFNAETPVALLADNFLTPNELFFVRNHLPVPATADVHDVKSKKFIHVPVGTLEITGVGLRKPVSLNVAELRQKFKVYTITSTIQCAGNRRSEMHKGKPVRGIQWGVAAVSTAEWTGVKLSDVLKSIGAKEETVKHVLFQGMDRDIESSPYEASIPAETAFDPRRDVLLAFEMNGKELPRDHGYPLRVIVPGTVGARQVKWLQRIILDTVESQSFWQQKDYKVFNPSTDWDSTDLSRAVPIQDYPVQSAICYPLDGSTIDVSSRGGEITVKGYAMSGGGRGIVRVDVTVDGGQTWYEATLRSLPQPVNRQWAWALWEVKIPLPSSVLSKGKEGQKQTVEVVCKATDSSHSTQPESDLGIWNMRGLLENKWHRITVSIGNQ